MDTPQVIENIGNFFGLSKNPRYAISTLEECRNLHLNYIQHFNSNQCWLWEGIVEIENGYGRYQLREHKVGAHIVVYRYYKGDYAEDLELDHLCRMRRCVNPNHLEPVTHAVNVFRGISPIVIHMYIKEILNLATGGEEKLCLNKMLKMPK